MTPAPCDLASGERRQALCHRLSPRRAQALCDRLLKWFKQQQRDLPWRKTDDPYCIWVSEVMLTQTRVETVLEYYHRFIQTFPDIQSLAAATLDDVLKRWEGLGYYARARNLHRSARVLAERGQGVPRDLEALRKLPGIGRYTAGAILSMAFNQRTAAVDGNVGRVLSRLHADDSGKDAQLWASADALMAKARRPQLHNQALMELGATVCTPRNPACGACPLTADCLAHAQGDMELYPRRMTPKRIPTHDVCAGMVWSDGRFLIVRRPPHGLLGGLWDLPSARRAAGERLTMACRRAVAELTGAEVHVDEEIASVEHVFTHFRMRLHAFSCGLRGGGVIETDDRRWIVPPQRKDHAFPTATRRVFEAVFGLSP